VLRVIAITLVVVLAIRDIAACAMCVTRCSVTVIMAPTSLDCECSPHIPPDYPQTRGDPTTTPPLKFSTRTRSRRGRKDGQSFEACSQASFPERMAVYTVPHVTPRTRTAPPRPQDPPHFRHHLPRLQGEGERRREKRRRSCRHVQHGVRLQGAQPR
jgi:hypothetical protein